MNNTDASTTIVLSDLTPGTQYNFSVRAFTVAFGPFSDQLSLHTADGEDMLHYLKLRVKLKIILKLQHSFLSLPHSVPSVPQGVMASSNGLTAVFVTWMEPAVFFRKHCDCI